MMPTQILTKVIAGETIIVYFKPDVAKELMDEMDEMKQKWNSESPVLYTECIKRIFIKKGMEVKEFDLFYNCGFLGHIVLLIRKGLQRNIIHSTCKNNCILYSFNKVHDKVIIPSKTPTLYLEGLEDISMRVKLDHYVAEIEVHNNVKLDPEIEDRNNDRSFCDITNDAKEVYIDIPDRITSQNFNITINITEYDGKMYTLMNKKIKVCRILKAQNSRKLVKDDKKVAHKKIQSSKKKLVSLSR